MTKRLSVDVRRKLTVILALLTSVFYAGAGSALGAPTEETARVVISLQDISCQSCGVAVVRMLERHTGVEAVDFDRDTAELSVTYRPAQIRPGDLENVIMDDSYGTACYDISDDGTLVYAPAEALRGNRQAPRLGGPGRLHRDDPRST